REWLVTNGLGGYASGTVPGVVTRRYHGLLVAALAAPLGRVVMLSRVTERLRIGHDRHVNLKDCLTEFRLEDGLPVWRFDVDGSAIEKRIFLPYMQNTVHMMYARVSGDVELELTLRPSVNFRVQEAPVSEPLAWPYELRAAGERYEIVLAGS